MIRAVIFDMDGVIIDSEPLHLRVVFEILASHGVQLAAGAVMEYVGRSNSSMWAELIPRYGITAGVAAIMELQNAMNIRALRENTGIMVPGIPALLAAITRERLKTAIASSSTMEYIRAVLDALDLTPHFGTVVSGEEVLRGKPAPDIFLAAAAGLGAAPGDCAVIEDSGHGVTAALAAGMKVAGFRNPNSGNQDLSRAHAVVDSMEDITVALLHGLW